MPRVRLHYWAGARAVAGSEWDSYEAPDVRQALVRATSARDDPRFDAVLAACSFLVDGVVQRVQDLDAPLAADAVVDVMPPFAGGSGS